ncbi:MAG: hypothetical protein MUE69_13020 [Myxococcota bacterium]|nr:hypothetical protein [Myxococcota bacterium]
MRLLLAHRMPAVTGRSLDHASNDGALATWSLIQDRRFGFGLSIVGASNDLHADH